MKKDKLHKKNIKFGVHYLPRKKKKAALKLLLKISNTTYKWEGKHN